MTRPRRPTSSERATLRRKVAAARPACHICGEPIDYTLRTPHPDSFELDHLVPLSRGGDHTLDNVAAAHRRCNRAKAARPHAPIVRRSGSLT